MIHDLFFYGAGVPRYGLLWLLVTPVMTALAHAAGLRGRRLALLLATTLPTFGLHFAAVPGLTSFPVRWAITVASLSGMIVLLVDVVRNGLPPTAPPRGWARRHVPAIPAMFVIVMGAVAIRAVWAWVDPGIADIPQASEYAARQVLAGLNPYVEANPYTYAPVYQYPAGTILWHLPFVALVPDGLVLGETFVAARMAAWAMDALGAGLLCVGGWVASGRGRTLPILALLPAALYGLNATLVREVGLTGANDVLMGVLLAASVWLLAEGHRPTRSAVLWGLAVAVKLPALAVAPLFLVRAGWGRVMLAGVVALVLQVPFFAFPDIGLHGLEAMAEPAARPDPYTVMVNSIWWPLYAARGVEPSVVDAISSGVVLLGLATSTWGVWSARRMASGPDARERLLAVSALAVVVMFLLAPQWRVNFQSWHVPATVVAAVGSLGAVGTSRQVWTSDDERRTWQVPPPPPCTPGVERQVHVAKEAR
ncbi:glycosyltransferase family 87 protein [Euzebya rosea]|uniref:glycosyltransferase family 87 protein n=1 Tax=Euzebya rosea TaxID=2052804 RepID=UPI001300B085|nr:glycosyltransferase family 87 protein [Euzebya rosea]